MVEPEVIKRAIYHQFPVRPENVTVVRHAPEDFFIDFKHRHHRDEAAAPLSVREFLTFDGY